MPVAKSNSRPVLLNRAEFVPDDRQREAIEHVHGPMLVVAGAGTGKTSVLTHRIARLIGEGHARPDEILALTYTENAAREMLGRVKRELHGQKIVGEQIDGLQATTFHAYCNNLLTRNGRDFAVLGDEDLWIFLRRRIRDLQLKHFVRPARVAQFLKDLLEFVRRCHDELVSPQDYAAYVGKLQRGEVPVPRMAKSKDAETLTNEEVIERCQEIAGVFALTEQWLAERNWGTFGHMITRAHDLLDQDEKLLAEERGRARFILVDEFQDVNFAQIKILARLAGEERSIFAVGDPDQAIYRFRGASSAAFGLFQRHFPAARLVVLGKNRRSTTPILGCAFAVIDKNPPVFGAGRPGDIPYRRTPLESVREETAATEGKLLPSSHIEVVSFADEDAEAPDVVALIMEKRKRLRCPWNAFGILYRSHWHRDEVAEELAGNGIPFLIEEMDVTNDPQVRDLLACARVIVSPRNDTSLFRVAALPKFAIDPVQFRTAMRAAAKAARESEREAEKSVSNEGARPEVKDEARDAATFGVAFALAQVAGGSAVLETVQLAKEEIARTHAKAGNALKIIIRRFALDVGSPAIQAVLDFVTRDFAVRNGDVWTRLRPPAWEDKPLTEHGDLAEFVEYLELFGEANGIIPLPARGDEDAVRLMTAHAAKGLEFDHVFILRASGGSFPLYFKESLVEFPPSLRDEDAGTESDKTLHDQEERRLFYVAMTRARDSITIHAAQGKGKIDPTPTGFTRDLIKDRSLRRWLEYRKVQGSQRTLYAEAAPAYAATSHIAEWIPLLPDTPLHVRLSASALDAYDRCPSQFKMERDWRLPREAIAAMRFGAAMHRVLRTYYDAIRAGRSTTDEELLQIFRNDLDAAGIQELYQHELYLEQGIAQLGELLATARSSPAPNVLHTEEWFEVRVGETVIAGRIDRMDSMPDGRVAVIDYKTGKPREERDATKSLQLSIYALAAREKWSYDPAYLAFHNLQDNTVVTTQRTQEEIKEACNRIEDVAHDIAAGKFDPNPGFHCKFCAYRILCPATEKRVPNSSESRTATSSN